MEMILYTLAALVLYVASDWILNKIEISRGARFEHRSVIFFGIILVLSLIVFSVIQNTLQEGGSAATPSVTHTQTEPPAPSEK